MSLSRRPSGASVGSRSRPPASSIVCNACRKNITNTCFHVKCDCLFCEDCTFSHFAESDQCPSCGAKPLAERDFTEILVSEPSLAPDLQKTTFQNMMSMRRNASSITFPEVCAGILRQMDTTKNNAKFLLKQMIKDSSSNSQRNAGYGALKQQNTQLKKECTSIKNLYQQAMSDFKSKMHNKEKANAELQKRVQGLERQIDVLRRGTPSPSNPNVPVSRSGAPPLQGIIAQKRHREAQALAQQEAMMGGRQVLGSRMSRRSDGSGSGAMSRRLGTAQGGQYPTQTPMQAQPALQRGHSYNGGPMRAQGSAVHRQIQQNITPMQNMRPFTSSSGGSGNRIRELTATSGYNFTSAALGGGHVNKRRRMPNSPAFNSPQVGYGSQSRKNPYDR